MKISIDDGEQYLAVCTATTLRIYRIQDNCLCCTFVTELFGIPRDMAACDGANEATIILTLDECKIVVFRFKSSERKLDLILPINAEENAFGLGSELSGDKGGKLVHGGAEHAPLLTIDEHSLVAAVIVYGHQLLLTPLRGDAVLSHSSAGKPFLLRDLSSLGIKGSIYDINFLHGYSRPTLAVLHELAPLPLGHLGKMNCHMSVSVIAVDVPKQSGFLLWRQNNIPHDSFRVIGLVSPQFSGAVMVVSLNAVVILDQNNVLALAFNGFARHSVHKSIRLRSAGLKTGIELDASRWLTVGDGHSLLVSTKTGALLHLRLLPTAEGSWLEMTVRVEQVAMAPVASCICKAGDRGELIFLGSRQSDALLMQAEYNETVIDLEATRLLVMSSLSTPGSVKKARRLSRVEGDDLVDLALSFVAEERAMYGVELPASSSLSTAKSYQVSLTILDTVPVLGAALCGHFGGGDDAVGNMGGELDWTGVRPALTRDQGPLSYIVGRETKDALHVLAGAGDEGSMYRVSRGVRRHKLASRNFPGALAVSVLSDEAYSYLFVAFAQKTRVMRCQETESGDGAVQEVPMATCPFVLTDATIAVGSFSDGLCVQVFASGLRVVRLHSGEALQDVMVEEEADLGGLGGAPGESICMADVSGTCVALLTNKRRVYLLQYDPDSENLELKNRGIFGETEDPLAGCISAPPSSVSLYKGRFLLPAPKPNAQGEQEVTGSVDVVDEFDQVEAYLYGRPLREDSAMDTGSTQPNKRQRVELDGMDTDKLYLLVCDVAGGLNIVDVESMLLVFRTLELSNGTKKIRVPNSPDFMSEIAVPEIVSRKLANARLQLLRHADSSDLAASLCLVVVLETYDVMVYQGIEECGELVSFNRVRHSCVTRRRSRSRLPFVAISPDIPTHHGVLLHDYSIHSAESADGSGMIIVSGPHPVQVTLLQGVFVVMPISFPEVPFANVGSYLLAPLNGRRLKGVATLWHEREESEVDTKPTKEAVVALYQDVPDQTSFSPLSALSFRRLKVGMTSHKCIEILPKTDDPIELALLKNKTFLMVCSENRLRPFRPLVLSEEEFEEERTNYERFFPDLESFCRPDISLGPAPPVTDRQFRLMLMTGGASVDTYGLREGEHVVDVSVLYLTVELLSGPPVGMESMSFALKRTRRVFVAASTTINDKHGEDSQGEGRLLFFSLDYAMFETQAEESDVDASRAADEGDDEKKVDIEFKAEAAIAVPKVVTAAEEKQKQSAAQAKFFSSIQPKLRLAWEGPGPSTVVRQMGEYVLSTVGPTVYMYRLSSATLELLQVAFIYSQFYIADVTIIGNFIYLADATNGVQMVMWREEDLSLTFIASDFDDFGCIVSGHLLDKDLNEDRLGILVADDECNIKLLQYNPNQFESSRLTCTADFHMSGVCSFMASHRLLGAPLGAPGFMSRFSRQRNLTQGVPFSTRLDKSSSSKTCLLIGSTDGALGVFLPVEERAYRRLALLQQILSAALETSLALNPRDAHIYRSRKVRPAAKRGVLDGSVLWRFVGLEAIEQDEFAAAMGTTADLVLENLHELDVLTSFF